MSVITSKWVVWAVSSALSLTIPIQANAQSVRVMLEEVEDNRMSEGPMHGGLTVQVKLVGDGVDGAAAARLLIKSATDDRGTNVLRESDELPDFEKRDSNMGIIRLQLANPARDATTVRINGNVELFVPKKDPNSIVKVPNALKQTDKPLNAKGLKAAKIDITVLSTERYAKEQENQKLDEEKIAQIREEGKRQGVDEKEIEAMIELAKAFQELGGGPVPEGSVILLGKEKDFDRLQGIRILKADGSEIHVSSSSSSSDGTTETRVLNPDEVPPANATLEFTILTDKARVVVPFDIKEVPLP